MKFQPWYAVGELVDNSIQGYVANRDRLRDLYADRGERYQLKVVIETDRHDQGKIVIAARRRHTHAKSPDSVHLTDPSPAI